MSVNQETLSARHGAIQSTEKAPELEYSLVSNDSLTMFGAAIGGAILGTLLTLLVLAIANGGTLRFGTSARLGALESNVARINDNVGAASYNIDILAEQLGIVTTALDSARGDITNTSEALTALDITRQQFDTFIGALSEAMTAMEALSGNSEAAVSVDAAAAATTSETAVGMPLIEHSADVAANAITILLFVDANGNGALDEGEALETGVMATLLDAEDTEIAAAETTDAGVLFAGLHAGTYLVSIAGMDSIAVDVTEEATEGAVVFIPVASE